MSAQAVFDVLLPAWFGLAGVACCVVLFVSAPYGRHVREGWGWSLPARTGWVLMELPAVVVPVVVFVRAEAWTEATSWIFAGMWLSHYTYRTFWWPLTTVQASKRMPVLICALALVMNIGVGWLNAVWVFELRAPYGVAWLLGPRFIVGAALFFGGMWLNRRSDAILRGLRAPGETGYKIPRGGGYRWVSCPNYLGELIEWAGWAIATWSLAGLAFWVWTAANLVPRARQNHRWYHETFADYPRGRKALIPGVF